jgi:NAD(P)-dependent dehydrogenase (short-subunit alcohol dehydrogenase family)
MQIADQNFLISGGASGLGAACARRLNAAGANVLIADMATEPGAALAAELGSRAGFVQTDVTSEESVCTAVKIAVEKFGPLAGAINCAGILGAARVVGKQGPHDLELFRRMVEVNLIGTFNVCRLAADAMSRNAPSADGERGVLVNTSSVAAWDGQIGQAAYSASKGGVAAMALPMARDLARLGIRVVAIAPGVFETPMVTALPDEAQAALAAQVPFPPRLGRPDEFAALVEHAITNTMLNGCTLRLDGALRMSGK